MEDEDAVTAQAQLDRISKLTERVVELRQQMALQLAHVLLRTNAIWLDPEILLGALLDAAEDKDPARQDMLRARAKAFLADQSRLGGDETAPRIMM